MRNHSEDRSEDISEDISEDKSEDGRAEASSSRAHRNEAAQYSPDWVYRLSANLALLEGLIVAALGLFLIVNSLFSEVVERDAWVAEIAFATLGSAGLILASRGLRQRKNWGRAPVVLANLIAIPVAYYLVTSDRIILGILLGLIAIPALLSTWFSIPSDEKDE